MPHSPQAIARYKDRRWLQRREHEERAQVETVQWWYAHVRELGITEPQVLFANGEWLGKVKASSLFIVCRLQALGWNPESPRLMLAAPRGGFHGLFLYFKHPEARDSAEANAMKFTLANQGYEVATCSDADGACRTIFNYIKGANAGST
jgi:hypothetical protein